MALFHVSKVFTSMISYPFKLFLILLVSFALTGCFKSSEERAAEHYENGLKLMENGDLPRALVEFRNVIALDDDNLDAFRQMARANLELDRYQAAYGSYLRVVEQAPNDIEGRIELSELAFLGRNWEEFERHGAKLVEIAASEPKSEAVQLGLDYRAALLAKDSPKSDATLAKAELLAEELPDNVIARSIRIDGYVSRGKYRAALDLIDQSIAAAPLDESLYALKLQVLARLRDDDGLEAELQNMLKVFPGQKNTQETYLRYLLSRKRFGDAEVFLEQLVADATPETLNGAFVSLVEFIRQTKGMKDALTRVEAELGKQENGNPTWEILRASLIFDLGRQDDGIIALEQVLIKEGGNMTPLVAQNAQTALAQMLLRSGNEVGARQKVEEILSKDANVPGALKLRAGWLIKDDDTNGAISDLRVALDQEPNDTDAMLLMARAYERAGNKELQQNFLAQAAAASNNAPRYAILHAQALASDEKFLQAETALIASLRIAPGNVQVLSLLGNVYLQLADLPRAEQVVQTLEEIDDNAARMSANRMRAELVARRLGIDEALAFLEAQAGNDAGAKLSLIQARLRAGKVEDALRSAKEAVEQEPENLNLRNALALSYAASRDYTAAAAEFEALIEARPDAVSVYLQLARIRVVQDGPEAAAQVIDRGLEVTPDAPDLLWGKASFLQNSGDIDGAIAIYESLYKVNSDNLVIANNLASLLTTYRDDKHNLARAETIARRLNGTDIPAFQDTYGWILFRTGKAKEAIAYLEPAAAGLPQDANAQFHLGQAYAATDRPEDALAQMRKALDVAGPLGDTDFREKVKVRIAELEASSE